MIVDYNQTIVYLNVMLNLTKINTTYDDVNISKLFDYVDPLYRRDLEDSYSVPMFTIGLYIAVASLFCALLMLADLVHGLRSNKLWFPCKYFNVDALSLALIAVAMKLPADLSGSMPGVVDQIAKLGSMAFMCIMMANFLPSLATMGRNQLLTNIIALGVLVITLVVNICIQITTGVIVKYGREIDNPLKPLFPRGNTSEELQMVAIETLEAVSSTIGKEARVLGSLKYDFGATCFVILLLLLLIIHISSSLAVLKSKQIIERKYQQQHAVASKDVQQPSTASNLLTVQKLQKHVSNYWIMAGTGSPQFMSVCSATTAASGFICVFTFAMHAIAMSRAFEKLPERNFGSDYKEATVVILMVQTIGVVVGTVAPVCRWVASIRFKVDAKSFSNDIKLVFKVEKHWTQTLYDWKYGGPVIRGHKLMVVIQNLKNLILNLCILLQKVVVVGCKIIEFVYIKAYRSEVTRFENSEQRKYVLQLENEDELAERTLKGLLKSFDQLIRKGEKKQPENLMKLITEKTTDGFQGVRKYENNDYHGPSSGDCWSLPVVTLTTIAVTLPNIEKAKVESLLKSVREGLKYVTLVEETLNATDDDNEIIRKAAKLLWGEVDFSHKWLGIKLKDISSSQVDTTTLQILHSFLEKAKGKSKEGKGSPDGDSKFMTICADSMSRVTQTIIADDEESHKKLFDELSSRIADIMAACLTNLPQAIAMKCHTSVIEEREASVEAAVKRLGETKQIIDSLQGPLQDKWSAYLSMTTNDLPFINKWRAHLSEP